MTGRTLILEAHGWRGFAQTGGPLGMVATLGFVSVTWCPFLLTDWLKTRVGKMKNALKGDKVPPRAEMACYGEDRPVWRDERPLHRTVPRGRT